MYPDRIELLPDQTPPTPTPAAMRLPAAAYPPDVRGVGPSDPTLDGNAQRNVIPKIIPLAAMTASLAAGAYPLNFGLAVEALRIVVPTASMAVAVAYGRDVTATDYDDVVRYDPAGVTIPVPRGRYFTVGNVSATAADAPLIVVGLTRWTS